MAYKIEVGDGLNGSGDLEVFGTMEVTCTPPSLQGGEVEISGEFPYAIEINAENLKAVSLQTLLGLREIINTAIYDKERQTPAG